MKQNVGNLDKFLRIIIGLIILGIGFYFKSWWGLIGLLPIFTALTGFCLLYRIAGINTCKKP
ncbi:MAG TPA: DUF2892 domain-containing protein [bacterium]